MQKSKKKLSARITDLLESHDIRVNGVYEQDGSYIAEIEFWSAAGEDMVAVIWYDGTSKDFVEEFCNYASDFDADEHAEGLISMRGKNGIPNSVRELIDDADAIAKFLDKVARELYAIKFK